MKIIICIDDKNGMLFNKRRQSSDALLRRSILDTVGSSLIYMNEYSKGQFCEPSDNIVVCEDFLANCKDEDFCFVENTDITPYEEKIDEIVIYRWNRAYPSDVKFDAEILNAFKLSFTEDFKGNSHERITKEVYVRE